MQSTTGAAGAAAALTLAAGSATQRRVLDAVHYSYSAAPTGGRLTIASTGQTTYDVDLAAAGPGVVAFPGGFKGAAGQTVVVTLAGGGASVIGKVNVLSDWLE